MPSIVTPNDTRIVLERSKRALFIPAKHRVRPVIVSSVAGEHSDHDALFIGKPFCLFKPQLGFRVSERLEPVKFPS